MIGVDLIQVMLLFHYQNKSDMAQRINYDKVTLTDASGRNHAIVIVSASDFHHGIGHVVEEKTVITAIDLDAHSYEPIRVNKNG